MEVIHIRHQGLLDGDPSFLVSAVSLQSPGGGKKLIPHPFGQEVATFKSLQDAVEAIHRAGYDAECDGLSYHKNPNAPRQSSTPSRGGKNGSFEDVIDRVLPDLKNQLKDKSPGVVANAAYVLGEIGSEDAIIALMDCFHHDDASIRKNASDAVAKIGKPAIKALRHGLKDGQWLVRHTSLLAVVELAGRSPELLANCLPDVVPLLKDENWLVRSQAALVFGEVAKLIKQKQQRAALEK
jgi:bilin biosynthesis protein